MSKKINKSRFKIYTAILIIIGLYYIISNYYFDNFIFETNSEIIETEENKHNFSTTYVENNNLHSIYIYNNTKPYLEINGNKPYFSEEEKQNTKAFEKYSELDVLGRCGTAYANICQELMPTEERESIGHIKPTGWEQAKYKGIVNSNPPYLYNRCHLIAFCLAGENDNIKNLITGTRYFNVEGMLPFETKVLDYVKKTNNHVLYRVTPDFHFNDLLARGVIMEAYSVEDHGEGIQFCVYVNNIQPKVSLNYSTGKSHI